MCFWEWEVARSPCMSETQGDLSSDQLPGARGQGESQPRGLGFQCDLESRLNRTLLTRQKHW